MKGQRKKTKTSRRTLRPKHDTLRFAPNFTAYVLPPDVVCLYSDDRKFFLHGELYFALAAAIGERGKSDISLR
jgi:oxazoline/thiazoline synthase